MSDATGAGAGAGTAVEEADLREILGGLGLTPRSLRKWLAMERAFFDEHGGRNHYAALIDLFDACIAVAKEGR